MARVRVALRLRFTKLPNIDAERVFRDALSFHEPEDRSYDDLRAIVESKVSFMELPLSDYTVFYTEEKTGDRLVVDTAFFSALLRQWYRTAQQKRSARSPKPREQALLGESASQLTSPTLGNALHLESTDRRGSRGVGQGSSSSDDGHDDDDDDAREPDLMVTFEVELSLSTARTPIGGHPFPAIPNLTTTPGFADHPVTSPPTHSAAQLATLTRANLDRLCDTKVTAAGDPRGGPSMHHRILNAAFDGVGVARARSPAHSPATPVDPTADVHVRVADLTCPPASIKFFLRCIILAIRFKTPRPGMTVAELDLGDAEDVTQGITAVTFDDVVHKAIRDHLRGDRRQVLELRQVYVRRKSDVDLRYQTNAHPLLLRLDRSSKLEVVRVLAAPAPQPSSSGVVTVREQLGSAGVLDVTQLMGLPQHSTCRSGAAGPPSASENGLSGLLSGGAFAPVPSSSSSSSGPRRTTFTIGSGGGSGNAGASVALVSGVVPSAYGQELRARQEMLLRQTAPPPPDFVEPGVPLVTARDVRQREPLVEQHANREEQRKQRIRRKTEVSTRCLLCGLDCSDEEACMAIVRQQLTKSLRNRGTNMPSFEQVKRDLSDRRRVPPGKAPTRLLCTHTFVNSIARTVHAVHPRCAHLCSAYQSGSELEDIVECELEMNVCALCGLPGACVACYHPQCSEMYHVVCALYSGGYVNFGQRDPFLPCPACPRHTQVPLTKKSREGGSNVLHVDHSCWEDGVAFDSRVVESTDLRDPDENDGQ